MSKYLFKAPCPVIGCKNNSKDVAFQWYHSNCGQKMYVNSEAYLICESGHSAEMIDWRFKCDQHDYKEGSQQGLLLALTIMATLENIDEDWILDTCDKVFAQTRKSKNSNNKTYTK